MHDPTHRPAPAGALSIAVGIATCGRPDVLGATLERIAGQTRPADAVLVCPTCEADLPEAGRAGVRLVGGGRGTCPQRNAILDACLDARAGLDLVVFLDDDFIPAPDFLAETEAAFLGRPTATAMSGRVIADGVTGPGLSVADALGLLAARPPARGPRFRAIHNAYGCNMAVRLAAVRAGGVRFDEALPLYGWQEDVDFSRRLAAFGPILRCAAMVGVHLGAKSGRTSGLRLGYSQVANPVHLHRKGTLGSGRAAAQVLRNLASNAARAWHPEPWCDRRGRLRGNLLALGDGLRGRLDPRRILDL